MLINNKSLINTINKLNLTDDEREKFNKISEDDRGNFLYNGKPVWDEKDQEWYLGDKDDKFLQVPKGTIRRLTGIFLQYTDDPIKIQ